MKRLRGNLGSSMSSFAYDTALETLRKEKQLLLDLQLKHLVATDPAARELIQQHIDMAKASADKQQARVKKIEDAIAADE